MTIATWLIACLISYVLGCINAAYYWVRWLRGVDVRQFGSGNAGARNAGRVYGVTSFVIVLALDAMLGALAVVTGLLATNNESLLPGYCALIVVIGHVFPIQLNSRGGKGVAKAIGAVIALILAEATVSLWLVIPCLAVLLIFTHRNNIRQFMQTTRGS